MRRENLSSNEGIESYLSPASRGRETPPSKVIILGVGNILLSDEGVGVHVARELLSMDLPPNVLVVDGATDGFGLLDVLMEADRLIIIDAVRGGAPPGSIYRLSLDEIEHCVSSSKTSMHQIGIVEVLSVLKILGHSPRTSIIGIEPKSLDLGMELSEVVKEKVPRIVELVLKELTEDQK